MGNWGKSKRYRLGDWLSASGSAEALPVACPLVLVLQGSYIRARGSGVLGGGGGCDLLLLAVFCPVNFSYGHRTVAFVMDLVCRASSPCR